MNRRILKKRCKRAVEVLVAEHGLHAHHFRPAKGWETIDAPPGMEARCVSPHGFIEPGILKGTPLYWEPSPVVPDMDPKLPSELLADCIWWGFYVHREGPSA